MQSDPIYNKLERFPKGEQTTLYSLCKDMSFYIHKEEVRSMLIGLSIAYPSIIHTDFCLDLDTITIYTPEEQREREVEPSETPSADAEEMTDEEARKVAGKIFELCLEVNQSRYRKPTLSEYELIVCFNFFGRANAIGIAILSSNRLCDEAFRLCLSKPDKERKNFQQCIKYLEDLKNQVELSH